VTDWLQGLPEAIIDAGRRIGPHVLNTPTCHAHWIAGTEVHLKCEHLQHTGSFKLRGAVNRLLSLDDDARLRGVVAASTGNHGQGIARAAKLTATAATVYVPAEAEEVKIAPMRALGVRVETVDGDGLAAELAARSAALGSGRTFVSPYNDPLVVAGQGTIGPEMREELGRLDAVFVAVGGGGLISGVGGFLKHVQPDIQVVGCWPANAPTMARCLAEGRIHEVVEQPTISDGTAGGVEQDSITFESCRKLIDDQVQVSEAQIGAAMRMLAVESRWIVEGAAGVALAGCLKRLSDYPGGRVAVVLCGRNIAFDRFLSVAGFSGARARS